MLARNRYELQVGIVFVSVVILLILGIVWAKRLNPAPPAMTLDVRFEAVGGLLTGDKVLVSGYELGKVKQITLEQNGVVASLTLDRAITLHEGYSIGISMMNFTGEMGINITPGPGPELPKPYGTLNGEPPLDVAKLVQPAVDAMVSAQHIADTLRSILPPLAATSQRALSRADSTLAALSEEVAIGRRSLTATLADVREVMHSTQRVLTNIEGRIDTTADGANRMFASLTATSDSLRYVIAMVDSAGGTLGRLVADSTLYVRLNAATANLDSAATSIDSLAVDIKRNPKRYVQFSLF